MMIVILYCNHEIGFALTINHAVKSIDTEWDDLTFSLSLNQGALLLTNDNRATAFFQLWVR